MAFGLTYCKILLEIKEKYNYFWAIGGHWPVMEDLSLFVRKKWKDKTIPQGGLPQVHDLGWQKMLIDL